MHECAREHAVLTHTHTHTHTRAHAHKHTHMVPLHASAHAHARTYLPIGVILMPSDIAHVATLRFGCCGGQARLANGLVVPQTNLCPRH